MENQSPFELGTLVTVISAHPLHLKWFGIVIDGERWSKKNQKLIPKIWSKKYNIPQFHIAFRETEPWYFIVLGPGFYQSNLNKIVFDCIVGTNLKKAF